MNRKRKAEEDALEVAETCSFGCYLKENSHRNFKPENTSFLNLPEQNQTILKWRTGLINETGLVISTISTIHTSLVMDLRNNSQNVVICLEIM